MTTRSDEEEAGDGDIGRSAAFDAQHVYHLLQDACRSLEEIEEHAAAAHVAQAMAMVEAHYGIGKNHRQS